MTAAAIHNGGGTVPRAMIPINQPRRNPAELTLNPELALFNIVVSISVKRI